MKFLFSLFILVIMTKECNNSKDASATNSVNNIKEDILFQKQHLSGTYYVTFLKEDNIQSLNLTLSFDESSNRVSGFSGCNRYSGAYIIKENSILFSELIATKMYCEKTQEIENSMLEYLSKINAFSLKENTLILKNGGANLLTAQKESIEKIKNDMVLEYTTLSRGGAYKMIQISNKIISVQKSRDSKAITKSCSNEEWNKIISLLKNINLDNLSTLKAPSQARFYDGADIANLKVICKGITYDVPSFDHGNPAKEIKVLVKEILSQSENIE